MNVEQSMCAASSPEAQWEQIDWSQCELKVRRLQERIVKATQEGRYGKVKALQWLLTHSFYGRALAVKRVTLNQGKNTPGVDGAIWSTPASRYKAIDTLRRRGYQPQPLRRVYIPKSNGKLRPLGIPTMKDRAMQALYLLALLPVAETTADPNSYGFRPKRSTADAIEQCFTVLARKIGPQWVLEGDIRGCFDNISHAWMLTHIPTDKEVLRKWLKAGFMENRTLFPTEAGTPQGGIISPTLANLTLDGLERLLKETFRKKIIRGQCYRPKVNFVRYADDFIITGCSKELLEDEVKPLVEQFMSERGLQLSPEKTCITHIEQGFDFLGQNLRKFGGKLLITPSKKNMHAFLKKARDTIRSNRAAKQENMIRLLNPIIRGWASYHRHIGADSAYRKVRMALWYSLWRWATRRHPNKSSSWILHRYWDCFGQRKWYFAALASSHAQRSRPYVVRLVDPTDIAIRRYVKVKSDANPFDPLWRGYFESRKRFRGAHPRR
jgi:RNA-directed DNA polymerase